MSKPKASPRKFSEKIALLNKKESEGTAEFQKIIKEVEETTRAAVVNPIYLGRTTKRSSRRTYPRAARGRQIFSGLSTKSINYNTNTILDHHFNYNDDSANIQSNQFESLPPTIVPDICIFSIDDHEAAPDISQQQMQANTVMSNTGSYLDNGNNFITSAHSLPDISTLSFDSSSSNTQICSEQSPPLDEIYDANRNFITNANAQTTCYSSGTNHYSQLHANQQHTDHWSQPLVDQSTNSTHNQHSLQPSSGHFHQSYGQSQTHQHNPLMRACSSSAVNCSGWQNSINLQAPKINHHLSKSSTDNYLDGYLTDHYPTTNYCNSAYPNPQAISYPIIRSNSYGHIGDFNFSNHIKTHQPSASQDTSCNCYECCYRYYPET